MLAGILIVMTALLGGAAAGAEGFENSNPVFDARGDRIVFYSNRSGRFQLYSMDLDGCDVERLRSSSDEEHYPSLSPDGSRLLFSARRGDAASDVFVWTLGSEDLHQLTHDPATDTGPKWSPDGEWIAFESRRGGNADIYIVRPDGSQLRRITRHRGNDLSPAWHPDGERLAFQSSRSGNYQIYEVTLEEGARPVLLLASPRHLVTPAYAPDAGAIAYAEDFGEGNTEIMLHEFETGRVRRLTGHEAADFAPAWSPDGSQLVFMSRRSGEWDVFRIGVHADSEPVRLTYGSPN